MEQYLDEELTAYSRSDIYPFHMPGHKRRALGGFRPEEIDITEIEGFDNLHRAEGILRAGQERLAQLFGADESFWLVNGSTAGILAAVCGCVKKGGRLLIARNCHRSVYNAAYLAQAQLAYLYPEPTGCGIPGSIDPQRVAEALDRFPGTQAVVITSPTYDGVVSDIRAIARIVHDRQIPLIVDEAHGAHFGFSAYFPPKAVSLGADLCVESLHKTLPAYTQSAVLHMMHTGEGSGTAAGTSASAYRFDASGVRRYLDIFQSSSPSYVLMAGIDRCVRMLAEDAERSGGPDGKCGPERERGNEREDRPESGRESLFGQFEKRLRRFYKGCASLQYVRIIPGIPADAEHSAGVDTRLTDGIWARDPSKILIGAEAAGLTGPELYHLLLDRYHLQMEMASKHYVTALTTIMDTDEGFERLLHALAEIDREAADHAAGSRTDAGLSEDRMKGADRAEDSRAEDSRAEDSRAEDSRAEDSRAVEAARETAILYGPRKKCLEIAQAADAETESVPVARAAGRISAEFVCPYPPGIPILVPGEEIDEALIRLPEFYRSCGDEIEVLHG